MRFLSLKSGLAWLADARTMLAGNFFAQLLPLLALPLVARLYDPAQFGAYGVFLATLGVVGVIATLRWEFAILQAPDEKAASSLFWAAFGSSVILAVVVFCFFTSAKVDSEVISTPVQTCLPVAILLFGLIQALTYIQNRSKLYRNIVRMRLVQSVTALITILVISLTPFQYAGLLIGHLVGMLSIATVGIFFSKRLLYYPDAKDVRRQAVTFYRFALFSTPGALINNLAVNAPIFFIQKLYGSTVVGYINLINRYISSPLNLISSSLSQVFHQRVASEEYNGLVEEVYKLSLILFFIAFCGTVMVNLFAEAFILNVLGVQWIATAEILNVLIYSLAVRFIVSPLSCILLIDRFLFRLLLWQALSLIVVVCIFNHFKRADVIELLTAYAIADIILYLVYYVLIVRAASELEA